MAFRVEFDLHNPGGAPDSEVDERVHAHPRLIEEVLER